MTTCARFYQTAPSAPFLHLPRPLVTCYPILSSYENQGFTSQVEVLLPTFFLENKNKSKQTFFPNLKKRIMGSRVLAKYLTPYKVPFNGPELCTRVTYGGEESKILVETSKIKKLKYQMNEVRYELYFIK